MLPVDYLKGGLSVGLGQMPKCMLAKYSHLRFQKQHGRTHYGKKETIRMILAFVTVILSARCWENPWPLSGLWARRLLPAWLSWWKALLHGGWMSLLPTSALPRSPARSQHRTRRKSKWPGGGGGGSLCLAQKVLHCELGREQCANCSLFAEQGWVPACSRPWEASRAWWPGVGN